MPAVSGAQRRAMFAAASGKSTIGIPKKVGQEFADADQGGRLPQYASQAKRDLKRKALAGTKPKTPTKANSGLPKVQV